MLISFQAALDAEVDATDGPAGSLADVLFDRSDWSVRYLVVRAGGLLFSRKLLVRPEAVVQTKWPEALQLNMTSQQLKDSPEIEEHEPVSRRKEYELVRHFGWKPYWLPGAAGIPDGLGLPTPTIPDPPEFQEDPDLWNMKELIDYDAHCLDGDVGLVEDLIFDDQSWCVRYLVIDVENRITGPRVLIAPDWVESIDWETRDINLRFPKQQINECPPFDPAQPVNRDYENRLYDYYGRAKYWDG